MKNGSYVHMKNGFYILRSKFLSDDWMSQRDFLQLDQHVDESKSW